METRLLKAYKAERKYWDANQALRCARTRLRWDDLDGFTADEFDEDSPDTFTAASYGNTGHVRLRIVADLTGYDDSYLDTWTDIRESERKRIRKELWQRIDRDGVWGVIGEYWTGDDWEQADSCYGFIGDDWQGSGYDVDIMAATMAAYDAHIQQQARALEATRPDMYGFDQV